MPYGQDGTEGKEESGTYAKTGKESVLQNCLYVWAVIIRNHNIGIIEILNAHYFVVVDYFIPSTYKDT